MRSPFRHLLWLLLPLHACNDPTYVTVHVTTDVPCERLQGVSLTVGKLGALEDKVPTTRTAECNGSEIGTITVVPSAEDDGEFAVRVTMGIERDVETCTAPAYGAGCVVARRGLRFLPGESVELPIVLRQICNGIPCGPYDTCVRGSCVPATCKDSRSCNEDKLAEGGGDPGDAGGGGDSGDAAPLGPDSDPVSLVEPYCGVGTALDPKAAWAIRGGCVTRAGVSRFHGPVEQGMEVNVIDSTQWMSITVEEGARAWGVTKTLPSSVTLEQSPFARQVFFPSTPGSIAYSPAIFPTTIFFPHQSGVSVVPRTPSAPEFPKGVYTAEDAYIGGLDAGTEPKLGYWVPYSSGSGLPSMYIVTGGPPRLRRIGLGDPPAYNGAIQLQGTKYSDPAISPDGNTLYIATDLEVHAVDPKITSTRWASPAVTALVGFADRKQNFDTLVFVLPDGAAMGDWVLRTYSPAGAIVGADVPILTNLNGTENVQLSMALALIRGSTDDVAIVTDGTSAYGVDLTARTVRWHTTDLPANGKAQILSTPDVTYIATPQKLHAIDPTNGKVIFTRGTLWGIPSDIAIGPGRTLYVTEPVAPYRAGPRL